MKIAVVGTRGFPNVQGGVETHCMELYPRLAALSYDITVMCRKPYTGKDAPDTYKNVTLKHLPSPTGKRTEAIVHTLRGIIKARRSGADAVHIHACGPALLTPLVKLLGMKAIVTLHGEDYRRAKWGPIARLMLKAGQWCAARFSDRLIVLTPADKERISAAHPSANITVIPNGIPTFTSTNTTREKIVLAVGRLTPEKGFHNLIEAWGRWHPEDYRLIIAGAADHPDDYSESLKALAQKNGIEMSGRLTHEQLADLYSRSALFIMPSLLEGMPIALLEAMAAGMDVAVSDIPSCRLPQLSPGDFFAPGSSEAIIHTLRRKLFLPPASRTYDLSDYDWDKIAASTAKIYSTLK